jgi:hypothetical protein
MRRIIRSAQTVGNRLCHAFGNVYYASAHLNAAHRERNLMIQPSFFSLVRVGLELAATASA